MCITCEAGFPLPQCSVHLAQDDGYFLEASLKLFCDEDVLPELSSPSSLSSISLSPSPSLVPVVLHPAPQPGISDPSKGIGLTIPPPIYVSSVIPNGNIRYPSRVAEDPSTTIIFPSAPPPLITLDPYFSNNSANEASPIHDWAEEQYSVDSVMESDDEYYPPSHPTTRSTGKKRKGLTSRKTRSTVSSKRRSPTTTTNKAAHSKKSTWVQWLVCDICGHHQHPKRRPDFTRHLRIHETQNIFCAGVPLDSPEARLCGLTETDAYEWRGQLRVGGCQTSFARRDSLQRHLKNENISCIGNAY